MELAKPWYLNGGLRLLIIISGIVFACGGLFVKIQTLESDMAVIYKIVHRLAVKAQVDVSDLE